MKTPCSGSTSFQKMKWNKWSKSVWTKNELSFFDFGKLERCFPHPPESWYHIAVEPPMWRRTRAWLVLCGVGSYNIFLPCAGSIIEYHSFSQSNWIFKFFSGFSKAAQPAGGMAEIRTDLSLIPPNLDFFHNIVTSGRKSLAEKSYCVSRMTYFFMMLAQCGCFKDIFWRIIRF